MRRNTKPRENVERELSAAGDAAFAAGLGYSEAVRIVERAMIANALDAAGGSEREASLRLGIQNPDHFHFILHQRHRALIEPRRAAPPPPPARQRAARPTAKVISLATRRPIQ